jgi:gliding motility-associated-like protein
LDDNGVTLNESSVFPKEASCSHDDGSITGIQATGATKYQWFNASGTSVGTSATSTDITGLPAGQYYLVASNDICSKTSQTYTIVKQAPAQNLTINSVTAYNCVGTTSGYIQITPTDSRIAGARLENSQHQNLGSGYYFNNLVDGIYYVYLTDNNGCETYSTSLEMKDIVMPAIVDANAIISPDQCGKANGGIKNITVSDPGYSYQIEWLAADGSVAGTSIDISGLKAGTYTLQIQGPYCTPVTKQYTVDAMDETIASPSVKDVQLCSAGQGIIAVENPVSGYIYKLYADAQSITPVDQETNGKFIINAKTNGTYYVSQADGSCESSRTAVQVIVGLSSANIANTFTPNGDGINDTWQITGIESYPQADVQVFNRFGQRVFESKGYSVPFDGTSNGRELPVGAYYFIIKLNNNCNVLTGSITIIR